MARARILAPWVGEEEKSAIYHCVSRVVNRDFVLGREEKEKFVELMRLYEEFCGVRVLSFCVMSNHFHLLVEVPPRMDEVFSDFELLEKLGLVMDAQAVGVVSGQLEALSGSETEEGRDAYRRLRERYLYRMWDLGQFMKTLKQRFSQWFNKRAGRKGTLWEERFSSTLVEGGYAARVTAAYIDLNPVRAGMVKDPKDYRWCGYAAAVAGGCQHARQGIARVLTKCDEDQRCDGWSGSEDLKRYDWRSVAGRYRLILYQDGRAPGVGQRAEEAQGRKRSKRKGFSDTEIEVEEQRGGELSLADLLGCKSRYFIDGAVIGSRSFVNGVIGELQAADFWKKPRKTGASRAPEVRKETELWSLRQLRGS